MYFINVIHSYLTLSLFKLVSSGLSSEAKFSLSIDWFYSVYSGDELRNLKDGLSRLIIINL